jgi:hypothetical protein
MRRNQLWTQTLGIAAVTLGCFGLFQNCSPMLSPQNGTPPNQPPGTDAGASDTPAPPEVSLDFCDDLLTVSNGTLCAIRPSALDSRTKDIYSTATLADRRLGFGYHVLGIPKTYDQGKNLWIHFTGTSGRPYDPANQKFGSATWLNEVLAHGHPVIQLAYDNRFSINTDTCQAPNPGADRDNCAGEAREEVLTGVDLSPYRSTDIYNSVDFRLKVLLNYLLPKVGPRLPAGIDPNNFSWAAATVSGHSQGGNLAYYIAKNRGVTFACMLGSPYDVADSVAPGPVRIADWFTTGVSLTPVSRLGQFVTTEDDSYTSFHAAALLLGMTYGQEAFESTLAPYHDGEGNVVDGHEAAVNDPSLASLRAQACFR